MGRIEKYRGRILKGQGITDCVCGLSKKCQVVMARINSSINRVKTFRMEKIKIVVAGIGGVGGYFGGGVGQTLF